MNFLGINLKPLLDDGGPGLFGPVMEQILILARDAWGFLVGLIVVVALLGGLFYVLQGSAGMAFGGSKMATYAILGVVGLVIMVLIGFLILPQLGDLLEGFKPDPPFRPAPQPWEELGSLLKGYLPYV